VEADAGQAVLQGEVGHAAGIGDVQAVVDHRQRLCLRLGLG
jgi:hypothetical protein